MHNITTYDTRYTRNELTNLCFQHSICLQVVPMLDPSFWLLLGPSSYSKFYNIVTPPVKEKLELVNKFLYKPPHDKTNKKTVQPAKTQISMVIRPVWSESSLSAWRKLESLTTHWAHSEDSDQTGRMPRLIWVFAGRTVTLLVFSRGGSYRSCVISKR